MAMIVIDIGEEDELFSVISSRLPLHMLGCPLHMNPASIVQFEEHPSPVDFQFLAGKFGKIPSEWLPSSHVSKPEILPSPHVGEHTRPSHSQPISTLQSTEHPSPSGGQLVTFLVSGNGGPHLQSGFHHHTSRYP